MTKLRAECYRKVPKATYFGQSGNELDHVIQCNGLPDSLDMGQKGAGKNVLLLQCFCSVVTWFIVFFFPVHLVFLYF